MTALLVLPIIIPLITAAVCLLVWPWRQAQRVLGLLGSIAHCAVTVALFIQVDAHGILATQLGGWPAPYGITFVADLFSAVMVAITGIMGLLTLVYSLWSMDKERESFGYYPLLHVLLMGVSGAFLTGDIFNMFVWFEVMLMASFVLLALGGERPQLEGAIKYVTLNLVSSAIFLSAVGLLYGMAGSLNMADLALRLQAPFPTGLTTTLAMLFLVAFGIKSGLFPLFFWLPASYHTPPAAVSAIFSALLTKVGVYALIRIFTLLFTQNVEYTHTLLLVIAGLTMVTGVLGAAAQYEFRRILSFHIVSQIGYILVGLALYTPLALAASIYFMVHNILSKTNLFLIAGVVHRLRGSYELKELSGVYTKHPYLAGMFIISAMSLAGVPPLSGFFGKLALIIAGLEIESYAIIAAALVVSILTLFSMTKIWAAAFWGPTPVDEHGREVAERPEDVRAARAMMAPVAVLAAFIVALGVGADYFFDVALRAADQLAAPEQYIRAVLGDAP